MKLTLLALTLFFSLGTFAQAPMTGQAASGDTERELCDGRVDGSEGTKSAATPTTPAAPDASGGAVANP